MMYDVILFVTLAVLAGKALGQNPDGSWNVGHYPDPIDYPWACGRDEASFVCDPGNELPREKVNLIDGLLKSIYNETNSNCYSTTPKRRGWLVMLAVVPKMEKYFTKDLKDDMKAKYREAVFFSYILSTADKWGRHSAQCDDMAVIIYAVKDNVLFTMTRPRIREVLTDSKLQDITWKAHMSYPHISQSKAKAAEYITYIVGEYKQILKKKGASG